MSALPFLTPAEIDELCDWQKPPRTRWEDSPLARWHADQQAAKAEREAAGLAALAAAPKLSVDERLMIAAKVAKDKRLARTALINSHAGKRRAAKLQRTPPWADLAAIEAIYAEAHRLTQATGVPHHVDHEIPLQGRRVSGLHVQGNLQILTGAENSRKHNRFEIEP